MADWARAAGFQVIAAMSEVAKCQRKSKSDTAFVSIGKRLAEDAGVPLLLVTVALALGRQDMGVVQWPVEQRRGQRGIAACGIE
ncbi:MAG: hypothetical protein ABIK82_11785 [Pseudomonadota bacterium]